MSRSVMPIASIRATPAAIWSTSPCIRSRASRSSSAARATAGSGAVAPPPASESVASPGRRPAIRTSSARCPARVPRVPLRAPARGVGVVDVEEARHGAAILAQLVAYHRRGRGVRPPPSGEGGEHAPGLPVGRPEPMAEGASSSPRFHAPRRPPLHARRDDGERAGGSGAPAGRRDRDDVHAARREPREPGRGRRGGRALHRAHRQDRGRWHRWRGLGQADAARARRGPRGLPVAPRPARRTRGRRGLVSLDRHGGHRSTPTRRSTNTSACGRRSRRRGICLQSYLRRTVDDITRLLPLDPAIRLVKGAYDEPESIAYRESARWTRTTSHWPSVPARGSRPADPAGPGHARCRARRADRGDGRPGGCAGATASRSRCCTASGRTSSAA